MLLSDELVTCVSGQLLDRRSRGRSPDLATRCDTRSTNNFSCKHGQVASAVARGSGAHLFLSTTRLAENFEEKI